MSQYEDDMFTFTRDCSRSNVTIPFEQTFRELEKAETDPEKEDQLQGGWISYKFTVDASISFKFMGNGN